MIISQWDCRRHQSFINFTCIHILTLLFTLYSFSHIHLCIHFYISLILYFCITIFTYYHYICCLTMLHDYNTYSQPSVFLLSLSMMILISHCIKHSYYVLLNLYIYQPLHCHFCYSYIKILPHNIYWFLLNFMFSKINLLLLCMFTTVIYKYLTCLLILHISLIFLFSFVIHFSFYIFYFFTFTFTYIYTLISFSFPQIIDYKFIFTYTLWFYLTFTFTSLYFNCFLKITICLSVALFSYWLYYSYYLLKYNII